VPDFKTILILAAPDMAYSRNIAKGVRQYAGPDKPWLFQVFGAEISMIENARGLKPDGAIAQAGGEQAIRALASMNIPVVNVSGRREEQPFARVGIDDFGVGAAAADYFLQRGFRNFAFFGFEHTPVIPHAYSANRERGFADRIKAAGCPMWSHYETPLMAKQFSIDREPKLLAWLRELPKPVAVLCANDNRGRQLCDACRRINLRVPEDVAIMGVDNDEIVCELSYPPLSSVAVPSEKIGYEAAALLDRLFAGKKVPKSPVLLPPLGIVTRRSSDMTAIEDKDVAQAMRFIAENAHMPISVQSVADHLVVSRRWLEHKFKRAIGHTPGEEIRRVRLERAQQLLTSTDLSMPDIAARIGLSDARRLSVLFRDELNTTPTAYRQRGRIRN